MSSAKFRITKGNQILPNIQLLKLALKVGNIFSRACPDAVKYHFCGRKNCKLTTIRANAGTKEVSRLQKKQTTKAEQVLYNICNLLV